MKIIALDPGAARLGWASLEGGPGLSPKYVDSGILSLSRDVIGKGKKEPYQQYRLRLINHTADKGYQLFTRYQPERLVSEVVPPVGGAAFASNGIQAQLAATSLTVMQGWAYALDIEVEQISAKTVKKRLTGDQTASKVAVRNVVIAFFPHLKKEHPEWTEVFDESDAIGVGLSFLGYSTSSPSCGIVNQWRNQK